MDKIQEQITDTFELHDLPEHEREDLLIALSDVVFKTVMRKVRLSLDTQNQQKLTVLLEASADDPENEDKVEAIQEFIVEHVPDFERYVAEQVEDIRKRYEEKRAELSS